MGRHILYLVHIQKEILSRFEFCVKKNVNVLLQSEIIL
jgi:hypothetical protein